MYFRMDVIYSFGLHDHLPTIYDVVSTIVTLSPGGTPKTETIIRRNVIHAYAKELEQLWHKSFTKQHVKSLTTIKKKIRKELEQYFKSVQKFGDKNDNVKSCGKSRYLAYLT